MSITTKIKYCYGILHDLYQIGYPMKIINHEKTESETNIRKHMLAYCGNKELIDDHLTQELWLVKILPIHNDVVIETNALPNLALLKDNLVKKSFEKCYNFNELLPESAWAFCDLSSCCYIVLSTDKDSRVNISNNDQLINEGSNNLIIEAIQNLESTLEQEDKILSFNKHHNEYQELIKKSYVLESNIPYRQEEGILLAWLLFNTERSETALRNFTKTGEINDLEEYTAGKVRDSRFLILKNNIEQFISQASSLEDKGQIWATLNFTMYLLELIVKDEYNPDILNDFIGLYPIINIEKHEEALCSISPIQYSPQFTYTFLCIPSNFRYQFSAYFRQLLHEFFHYVPTDVREERSILLLRMYSFFTLKENANEENVDILVQYLLHQYKKLGHETLLFQDSMSLISTMRFILNRTDPIEYLKKQGHLLSDLSIFPSREEQIEQFIHYTFFLREIRSDISMIELLNSNGIKMGLKEYIQLMANEPNWATVPAEDVEPEPILRFGYMVKWIIDNSPYNPDVDVQKIIEQLIDSITDNKLKSKYHNLKSYLKAYDNEWKIIAPCKKNIENLATYWKQNKYLQSIKQSNFWKQFLNLYQNKEFDSNSFDTSTAKFDYGIKLLLMELPCYKEYFQTN